MSDVLEKAGVASLSKLKIAVFVGAGAGPDVSLKLDKGPRVHTVWGYLAWRLAGDAGLKLMAEAEAARQCDHPVVGPQSIAEQPFDAVGGRFAFDLLEQRGPEATMPPVVCNRHGELPGAVRAGKRHPGLADQRFSILCRRNEEKSKRVETIRRQCARQFERRKLAYGAKEPIVARLRA